MALVTGRELGQALCKALGLDPDVTGEITIVSTPGDIAVVTVRRFVTEEEVKELTIVLDGYALTKKPAA